MTALSSLIRIVVLFGNCGVATVCAVTRAGKPNPSSAASTIPAVIASTESCDISLGTQMLLLNVGTFVEIISAFTTTRRKRSDDPSVFYMF